MEKHIEYIIPNDFYEAEDLNFINSFEKWCDYFDKEGIDERVFLSYAENFYSFIQNSGYKKFKIKYTDEFIEYLISYFPKNERDNELTKDQLKEETIDYLQNIEDEILINENRELMKNFKGHVFVVELWDN